MDLEGKVSNKDIFNFLFPGGFEEIMCTGDDELLGDGEGGAMSDEGKSKKYSITCKCGQTTYVDKKSAYSNPCSHAFTCYGAGKGGELDRRQLVEAMKLSWDSSKVDDKVTEKVQQGILAALNRASPQDEALFAMMDLVCLENVPPSKWRTKRFTRHLAAGGGVCWDIY